MNDRINKNTNRLDYIDGLKGISCILILLHHFFLTYYPSTFYGNKSESFFYGFDTMLSTSPFGFFINGNFFIFLFILISGFVLTYHIINFPKEQFGIFQIKRYLKLSFPIFIYCTISFILFNFGINESFFSNSLNLKKLFKSITYSVLFCGDTTFGGPFWMLYYIFLGGIFVSITSSAVWISGTKRTLLYTSLITLFLFFSQDYYYATMFMGSVICLLVNSFKLNSDSKKIRIILVLLLILGLFLGGFPTGENPENLYKYLLINNNLYISTRVYHFFGAILFFIPFLYLEELKQLFSKKICLFLSKISYLVYIVHEYFIILFVPVHNKLKQIVGYNCSAFFCFIFITTIVILISYILQKFICSKFNVLINKLVK